MNFKQKLAYTALGGALVIGGMLFTTITPLTAHKEVSHFDQIICSSLFVVDKDRENLVELSGGVDGGFVGVSAGGTHRIRLYGKKIGGGGAVVLTNDEHGGIVAVYDKGDPKELIGGKNYPRGALGVDSAGTGFVATWDKHGNHLARHNEKK